MADFSVNCATRFTRLSDRYLVYYVTRSTPPSDKYSFDSVTRFTPLAVLSLLNFYKAATFKDQLLAKHHLNNANRLK